MDGLETQIDIPGMTLAAKVWGPADGRPVIAGHGWLDNAASFDRLAPRLEGVRLVAIDFPGHGRSDHRPEGMAYHFVDLIPVFFDVADALGWEGFSILGHSMGAAAASLVAGTAPERIERMVLIDGLGPWTRPAGAAPGQLAEGLEERKTLLAKENRRFEARDDALSTIARLYKLEEREAAPLVDRALVEAEDGVRFSYDLALRGASLIRFTEAQVLAFLRRITCPTLLVRPRDGWPVDQEEIERRMAAVDTLELEMVDGRHHVHLSAPERVAEVVGPFLASQPGNGNGEPGGGKKDGSGAGNRERGTG